MNDLRFFSQRPPWRELKFDEEHRCYLIPQYSRDKWLVSIIDHEKKIVPHIKTDAQLLPLVWDKRSNGHIIPRKDHSSYDVALDEAVNGRAGKLILYDQEGRELSPYLYLFTETISEEDYKAILDRLGQLAIAHESGVLAPVTVLRETSGQKEKERQLKGDAFENLARAIEENWGNIKSSPAKEIKLDTKIVDLTNLQTVHSVHTINQAVQKPHQRRQQILERQETYDSEENRFLVHVLKDILIPKAKPLADYFRSHVAKLKEIQNDSQRKPDAYRHGQNYLILWQERRVKIEQEVNRLESQAANIERIINKAEGYLHEPFLKDIASNVSSFRPSAKIADSKVYGPVYRAYQDYLNNAKSSQQKSLTWALEEKSIRSTPDLYEIWVFFEVYARLVHDFGFLPDGDSPFDAVEVLDGEITLQKGSAYKLYFIPKNQKSKVPICTAILSYSPKIDTRPCKLGKKCFDQNVCPSLPCYKEIKNGNWKKLTPDITLTLQAGGVFKKFALDAKYRNYSSQTFAYPEDRLKYQVDTWFDVDLFGTAKMKYHNALEYDVSFILHSDPNPEYTIFGEEPFKPTPLRERASGEWWPGHKIGAVCVTPSQQKGLDSLLRCFLMYHVRLVQVCWNPLCHLLLTEGSGMTKQPGYKGDYYQCPGCGEFWIGHFCGNKTQHHRLVKMGKSSFHKISPQNEWNCTCPACGNRFEDESKFPLKR